jgi:phosphatidylserine/phosphatidylglycerophosphate/cardiolipin synthase-like enzyme
LFDDFFSYFKHIPIIIKKKGDGILTPTIKKCLTGILCLLLISGCSSVAAMNNAEKTAATSPLKIVTAFTQADEHPELLLINTINGAAKTLDIAIYSITHKDIVASIIRAKKRGIIVRLITDKVSMSNKSERAQLILMKKAGIPIKYNEHPGLMHMKTTLIDDKLYTTGSFNYTGNASKVNDEVLSLVTDPKGQLFWKKRFEAMWNDKNGFSNFE